MMEGVDVREALAIPGAFVMAPVTRQGKQVFALWAVAVVVMMMMGKESNVFATTSTLTKGCVDTVTAEYV